MKRWTDGTAYINNRLVFGVRFKDGSICLQGKRVGADCPLTAEERRAYVKSGRSAAIKMIMARRKQGVRDAIETLNRATGERQ